MADHVLQMELDALNAERAVLVHRVPGNGGSHGTLTVPRKVWDELDRPAELLVHLTTPGGRE